MLMLRLLGRQRGGGGLRSIGESAGRGRGGRRRHKAVTLKETDDDLAVERGILRRQGLTRLQELERRRHQVQLGRHSPPLLPVDATDGVKLECELDLVRRARPLRLHRLGLRRRSGRKTRRVGVIVRHEKL